MIGALWALIPTSLKWIGLSVIVGLIGLGAWKWEHAAKLKAEADLATTTKGYQILDQGYVKLYQEREKIKASATKKRGQINAGTLDDLIDITNNPGGVRHAMPPNSGSGAKGTTIIRDSAGTEFIY